MNMDDKIRSVIVWKKPAPQPSELLEERMMKPATPDSIREDREKFHRWLELADILLNSKKNRG